MTGIWRRIFTLLLLLATSLLKSSDADSQWDTLNEMCLEMMKCNENTASFAISAVKDGEVIFKNAYGMADKENDIAATNSTRFSIGSISKEFTGYLAGKQVHEKEYEWSDKIVEAFSKRNIKMSMQGEFRNASATLEDAMTHRTTIKMYDWLLTDNRDFTRAQWMTEIFPLFEQQADMRSAFYYNNWLYTLVGYLTELVGGNTFEKQVKDTIFDPLGMTETCFVSDEAFDELTGAELARPYKEGSDGELYPIPISALQMIGTHNPAGGIVSTAGDMANYMIGVIDGYNNETGATLSVDVLQDISKPRTYMGMQLGDSTVVQKPNFPESFLDQGYGIGHIIGRYKGYKYINHGGSTYGHYSFITVIPSLKMGVFTVISGDDYLNQHNWRMQKLMQIYLLDTIMGETPWINATAACSFPLPWQAPALQPASSYTEADNTTIPNHQLYCGNYTSPPFPQLSITSEDKKLMFKMGNSNGTVVPLEDVKDLRFAIILNMPIDPVNLPDSEKQRAYLIFRLRDDTEVADVFFKMGYEVFKFQKSSGLAPTFSLTILLSYHLLS